MNELQTYILAILAQMQDEKKKARREPSAVNLPDLLNRANNDLKRTLWAMCKDGKVKMRQTLNSFSFEIV